MRYLTTALLSLSLCFACSAEQSVEEPPAVSAIDPDPAAVWLERIETRAADIQTLTATLRYDQNQLLLGDEQRRFGKLTYEAGPPPRFNVHFNKKLVDGHWSQPDLYYIYDGQWLLKRDHESKSAVRYQLGEDNQDAAQQMELGESPFPLPLNLKKDSVLAKFNVQVLLPCDEDPEPVRDAVALHLQLTPLQDNDTDLTVIDLWFDRESLLPLAVSTMDASETQTAVFLSDTKVNPELEDLTFDTALPTEEGWQTDENRIADTDQE